MSAINPVGNFDLHLEYIMPSGCDIRVVRATMGGALYRALDEYGTAGMPAGAIDTGLPVSPLPAVPVGGIRFFVSPHIGKYAYPDVSLDPGGPNDAVDAMCDETHIDVNISVAKAFGSYQVLKDWCTGLGGTFSPLPVRPA